MLLYIESKALSSPLTQDILQQFSSSEIIEIQHYKNLFDKTIGYPTEPCLILAKQEHIAILETPDQYGFPGKSFFFKPSLNCMFDCTYCYLKGSFKNSFPVIFVNYEDFKVALDQKIREVRAEGYQGQITFYASNYADLLAIEQITHFHETFIPFFEQYENVLLETRTKSANIGWLKRLAQRSVLPPARLRPVQTTGGIGSEANGGAVEIAFSLSPESIAQAYEPRTASLSQKLQAIQALLDLNYRVGLRFLPLLPVPEYENIYTSLLTEVKKQIDISRISSIFIAPLIYNQGDFAVMKKKNPDFPFRDRLHRDKKGLMKMEDEHYQRFLQIFQEAFPEKEILWDYR